MELRSLGSAAQSAWNTGGAIVLPFIAVSIWEYCRPRTALSSSASRWLANVLLAMIFYGSWIWLARYFNAAVTRLFGIAPPEDRWGLRFVAMLLVLDALQYVSHRLSHAIGPLWRLHAIHHTDTELDASTALRHHPIEAVVTALMLTPCTSLLGIAPNEIAVYGVAAYLIQLVAHANIALPPRLESAMTWLLVTPMFHRFHHARDERQYNSNYGMTLTIWDRLFRTAAPSSGAAAPASYGVTAFVGPRFQTLGGLLLQPFLPQQDTRSKRLVAGHPSRQDRQ